ncbi:MAG: type III polyketide synthase [Planctomycetota bacterium]|jgi:predicted naringenin-chalcone synthase
MTCFVQGLGTALPEIGVPQADAARMLGELLDEGDPRARSTAVLFRRSGIGNRHSVLAERDADGTIRQSFFPPRNPLGPTTRERMQAYARHAPALVSRAAENALADADVSPRAVTHLVTVSCTGFGAPGFDRALVDALGLDAGVQRTHVGFMGCHGALNGLRVARAFCESDPSARVLVAAVELSSLHVQPTGGEGQVVANALFADGAAAMVLGGEAHGRAWPARASGSHLFPDSEDLMTWDVGDHGFEIALSARVPEAIEGGLRPWLVEWLESQGVALENVGSWAVHPGGPRIVDAVERSLELPPEALENSRAILRDLGNMSSPTVLFLLDGLMQRDAPRPCVALGFGPGLFAEVALFA